MDVLPKDEALQAQLYQMYMTMGLVDSEWCQDHIPVISVDSTEIRKRMKADSVGKQPTPGMPTDKVPYNEYAPPQKDQASIPGPGGNPVLQSKQLSAEEPK